MILSCIIIAVVSYLLGNLNGAVVVSRLTAHEDVRAKGSGNAGLTNFTRNYGSSRAIFVILIDMGKAALSCLLGGWLLSRYGYWTEGVALGGAGVILGHDFPALLNFKGGKGILSGVTVGLCLDWRLGLLVFGIFLVAYLATQYVSLGSVLSSGSFGIFYAIFHWEQTFAVIVSLFLSGLIVWMHRENIKRLLRGQERKTNLFGKGKQK